MIKGNPLLRLLNAGKRSIFVNLKDEADRVITLALLEAWYRASVTARDFSSSSRAGGPPFPTNGLIVVAGSVELSAEIVLAGSHPEAPTIPPLSFDNEADTSQSKRPISPSSPTIPRR